jgi:hypothetical protein
MADRLEGKPCPAHGRRGQGANQAQADSLWLIAISSASNSLAFAMAEAIWLVTNAQKRS